MNEDTLVAVNGYAGDERRVRNFIRFQEHHGCPVVVLSPEDSRIGKMRNHICRSAGKRAYIGQESLDRQISYFKILLGYPFNYFLLNDSDSFVVSAEIPKQWYADSARTVWVNRVVDPRPHESPYPKWAFQPPYFLTRSSMQWLVDVAHKCPAHLVTPYIDHFMMQLIYEAGLDHRPFTDAESAPRTAEAFQGSDPWKILEYRIRYCGTVAMHPIKTLAQATMCARARKFYEIKS